MLRLSRPTRSTRRNSEIDFNLALALYQHGDARQAVPYLEQALENGAGTAETYYLLGIARFELKEWKKSAVALELARGSDVGTPEILFLLERAYRNLGEPAKSLAAAVQFLKAYPDSPLLHEMLGEAHDQVNEPSGAEEEFKAAIAGSPQAPQIAFPAGIFLLALETVRRGCPTS